MEDPLAVGVSQALAELAPDVEDALDRPGGAAATDLPQAHALDELRGDPGPALVQAGAEDRGDVRVAEVAGGDRVAQEARDHGRRAGRDGGVELEDGVAPLGVPRVVDDAARPAASLLASLECAEREGGLHGSPLALILVEVA
jgi:hypothetical protein